MPSAHPREQRSSNPLDPTHADPSQAGMSTGGVATLHHPRNEDNGGHQIGTLPKMSITRRRQRNQDPKMKKKKMDPDNQNGQEEDVISGRPTCKMK